MALKQTSLWDVLFFVSYYLKEVNGSRDNRVLRDSSCFREVGGGSLFGLQRPDSPSCLGVVVPKNAILSALPSLHLLTPSLPQHRRSDYVHARQAWLFFCCPPAAVVLLQETRRCERAGCPPTQWNPRWLIRAWWTSSMHTGGVPVPWSGSRAKGHLELRCRQNDSLGKCRPVRRHSVPNQPCNSRPPQRNGRGGREGVGPGLVSTRRSDS